MVMHLQMCLRCTRGAVGTVISALNPPTPIIERFFLRAKFFLDIKSVEWVTSMHSSLKRNQRKEMPNGALVFNTENLNEWLLLFLEDDFLWLKCLGFNVRVSLFSGGYQDTFTCQKCGRAYRTMSSLSLHLCLYCGVEPRFACPFCPYRAYQAVHVRQHMVTQKHCNVDAATYIRVIDHEHGFNRNRDLLHSQSSGANL